MFLRNGRRALQRFHKTNFLKCPPTLSIARPALCGVRGLLQVAKFTAESAPKMAENAEDSGEVADPSLGQEEDIRSASGEVKDPSLVFERAWSNVEAKVGPDNMVFPKDIMWLAGAPGAGKGFMTDFIMKTRGMTSRPIECSGLLKSPECLEIKAKGGLVSDRTVVQLLLERLLDPQYASGVIVDGFPRTPVQAQCIKLLYQKMREQRRRYEATRSAGSDLTERFRRPIFHITVLFIEEDLAVARQLSRGRQVMAHNRRVEQTGVGVSKEVRKTDVEDALARARYRQFKELIYESLQTIKDDFAFHFIPADGDPETVQRAIMAELEYQSSLELHELTFEKVRRLPLAAEIPQNSRHDLVRRLDQYSRNTPEEFQKVIELLLSEFYPIINMQALSGKAVIRTESPLLAEPGKLRMAMDLLSERGFTVVLDVIRQRHPIRIDKDQSVIMHERKVYELSIAWDKPAIRQSS
eukprot:177799_1